MASFNSTVDGMGFEEVNQPVTSTEIISGTMVYAGSRVTAPMISGTYLAAEYTVYTLDVDASRDVTNAEGELQSVSIGSGIAVYGAITQAGSGVLSSNEEWITFPVAYAGVPSVVVSNRSDLDAGLHVSNGSLVAGSFHVLGTNATDIFSWVAVGI